MSEGAIELRGLTKRFGAVTAVDDIHLDVRPGEFITLLGESGSGKSTTLLMIAGFEPPTAGEVLLDGRAVSNLPPYRRNLGMVFQSYALFPHMTVAENIAFPLKRRRMSRLEIGEHVREALRLVNLSGYEARYPRELSGGQQQRVAVARATVYRPPALLMDEPLSALDKKLRQTLQEEIRRLHRNLSTTIVYVTHDQDEALALSDRIVLMRAGRVEQVGTPREVYEDPRSLFAAAFLGEANLLVGEVVGAEPADVVAVRIGSGKVVRARTSAGVRAGDAVTIVVRPERLRWTPSGDGDDGVAARVEELVYIGRAVRCVGRFETGERWTMQLDAAETEGAIAATGTVSWDPAHAIVVPETPPGAVAAPADRAAVEA